MSRRPSQPPPREIASGYFSPDIEALLRLLKEENTRYLIVGGEAGIFHGYARFTGDVDIFYELKFSKAWESRVEAHLFSNLGSLPIPYIDQECLMENKRASGRPKDWDDVRFLSEK